MECEPNEDVATDSLAERDDQISLETQDIGDGIVLGMLESFTGTAIGVVSSGAYDVGVLTVACAVRASNQAYTTMVKATAAVMGASNDVADRFVVCQDGRSDAGAAGISLTLDSKVEDGGQELPRLSAVTDADGRFTFPDLPAGPYELSYAPPVGYRPNDPDLGNHIQLLVTGDGVRWETTELSVTTTDPTTSCA